jgi:hypothetical protein
VLLVLLLLFKVGWARARFGGYVPAMQGKQGQGVRQIDGGERSKVMIVYSCGDQWEKKTRPI